MFCMTENEKAEQIGKLAEHYSHLRGELNHVIQKLNNTQTAYQALGNPMAFQSLRVENGKIFYTSQQYGQPVPSIDGLLAHQQLKEIIEEKQRLTKELEVIGQQLKALAPHLL